MKPEISFTYSTEGMFVLPIVSLFWAPGWYKMKVCIGWLFWYVEIEWPVEEE
jgi:hypothetical protein